MQKKDIIYIDVEDDITAIIGKIKASKEKIIALVPPKRVGVLQSAVNLRLLARTANNAKKRIVIITGNAALSSLAASASIPVARTLQSRPELAELPDEDETDGDLIHGGDVAVGDHAGIPADEDESDDEEVIEGELPSKLNDIDIDGEKTPVKKPTARQVLADKKPKIKVPDFGVFRKKLALIAAGGVLLIAFLVWAIWFAPHATVVVSARTSNVEIQTPITIGEKLEVDNEKKQLPSVVQTVKQEDTVEIEPTGEKEVGEKATGTVKFYNCADDDNAVNISAGTYITVDGKDYVVQSNVSIPEADISPGSSGCGNPFIQPGVSADVKIVAEVIGPAHNVAAGTDFAVSGRSGITADASSAISGGSKKTVKVVSVEDVEAARSELTDDNMDEIKGELRDKFDDGVKIIEESFTVNPGELDVDPGLDEEVKGDTATLTIETVYTMYGIVESVLDDFLESAIEEQLGNLDDKRIYESGADSAVFSEFELSKNKKQATIQLAVTGKVGPKIDDNEIKDIARGKRYGEIEKELKAIEGVSDVKVNLSPFWVFTVPDDNKKITIEFKLLEKDD